LNLTEKERRVYELSLDGKKTKEIACELGLEASIVRTYKERIKKKLELSGRANLSQFPIEKRIDKKASTFCRHFCP
jgi:DNA-binding CsgD family transcriptional regulator